MKQLVFACALSGLIAPAAIAAPFDMLTDFIGFGDSLSDKGRLPSNVVAPPSLDGRLTDGPTWMEQVGAVFEARGGANVNLALGGATAGPNADIDQYILPEIANGPRVASDPDDIPFVNLATFNDQIDAFFNAGFNAILGSNPLVTIWLGGNDILDSVTDPVTTATNIITSLSAGISKLNTLDSRLDDFLVFNLPKPSLAPNFFELDPAITDPLDDNMALYNSALAGQMALLSAQPTLNVEVFDLSAAFDLIHADGVTQGLIANDACTTSLVSPEAFFINKCFAPGASDAFLFADNVHPTSFIHEGIADAVLAEIGTQIAPVPLPAGGLLMLSGFGALALIRRRGQTD